jgi:integrase
MAIQKLTTAFVQHAQAEPDAERSIYWDATLPGFGLMVTRSSARSFVVQYRVNGKSRRYTISAVLGLDNARKEARKLLGEVARGADPIAERRKATYPNTLRAVAESYLAREGKGLRTGARRRRDLERLVFPRLGDRPIDEIKKSDINLLLDNIEDQRGRAMADQILATVRRIFSWHAIRSDDFRSPIVPGMARRKPEERERARVLTDDELRAVWRAAEAFSSPWSQFIRYLLLTAARRTEASAMTWNELQGDLWVIPPHRYKTGVETTLPLSTAAMKVLAEIPRIADCEYVFTNGGRLPLTNFSNAKLRFDLACGVKNWRLHDLRRSSRSLMSRAGVSTDIAERCLGHVIPGIRGVYDKHQYIDEMRAAFEALAKEIDAVLKRSQ